MLNKIKRLINYTFKLKLNNLKLSIPVINGIGRAHLDGAHLELMKIIQYISPRNSLVIDIGANIGQTYLASLGALGNNFNYIGIDPNPICVSYLMALTHSCHRSNSREEVIVICTALGEESGVATLRSDNLLNPSPAASTSSTFRDANFYGSELTVPVISGDQLLENFDLQHKTVLLKIDAEGSEYLILKGLRKTIEKYNPVIIIEVLVGGGFSDAVLTNRKKNKEQVFRFLEGYGYIGKSFNDFYNKIKFSKTPKVEGLSISDYVFLPLDYELENKINSKKINN